jgi:hypothetical protein
MRKIKYYVIRVILLLIISASLLDSTSLSMQGGSADKNDPYKGVPHGESLKSGLKSFIEAQAGGKWDEVDRLLGRYRDGPGMYGVPFTKAHKQCLLSQMKDMPMISFEIKDISCSTEILSRPPESRWYDLMGKATFRTQSGIVEADVDKMTAYLDQGKWYFSPTRVDNNLAYKRVTEADFLVDRRESVEVELDPRCPLEIVNLKAFMDRKTINRRNLDFSLRNKTSKKIKGYGLRLGSVGNPCFDSMGNSHINLAPNEMAHIDDIHYYSYNFYCNGEKKERIVIDFVSFEDGSTWKDPRFLKTRSDCPF